MDVASVCRRTVEDVVVVAAAEVVADPARIVALDLHPDVVPDRHLAPGLDPVPAQRAVRSPRMAGNLARRSVTGMHPVPDPVMLITSQSPVPRAVIVLVMIAVRALVPRWKNHVPVRQAGPAPRTRSRNVPRAVIVQIVLVPDRNVALVRGQSPRMLGPALAPGHTPVPDPDPAIVAPALQKTAEDPARLRPVTTIRVWKIKWTYLRDRMLLLNNDYTQLTETTTLMYNNILI